MFAKKYNVNVVDYYGPPDSNGNPRTAKVVIKEKTNFVQLKTMIAKSFPDIPASRQRLYFDGTVLEDDVEEDKEGVDASSFNVKTMILDKNQGKTIEKPVVLVRLPVLETLPDSELFAGGDLKSGRINLARLHAHFDHEGKLTVPQARAILSRAASTLKAEKATVEVVSDNVTIVGDIHGQWFDTHYIWKAGNGFLEETPGTDYVFCGDYVDRGAFNAEMALFILACKVSQPKRFTLLRGNHESDSQMANKEKDGYEKSNKTKAQMIHKYNEEVYKMLVEAFSWLPICCVLRAGGKKFLCVHGGIGPRLNTPEELNKVVKDRTDHKDKYIKDYLWADPYDDEEVKVKGGKPLKKGRDPEAKVTVDKKPSVLTYDLSQLPKAKGKFAGSESGKLTDAMFRANPSRGSGMVKYTKAALHTFCRHNDILTVFRGHEENDGFQWGVSGPNYEFPCCITVFSAPNYTDKGHRKGAVVVIKGTQLSLVEYKWRMHPLYSNTEPGIRDVVKEDFYQFINNINSEHLYNFEPAALDAQYGEHFPKRVPEDLSSAYEMWHILSANIDRIPALFAAKKTVTPENMLSFIMQQVESKAKYFEKVNTMLRCKRDEAEYELSEAGSDDDDHNDDDHNDKGKGKKSSSSAKSRSASGKHHDDHDHDHDEDSGSGGHHGHDSDSGSGGGGGGSHHDSDSGSGGSRRSGSGSDSDSGSGGSRGSGGSGGSGGSRRSGYGDDGGGEMKQPQKQQRGWRRAMRSRRERQIESESDADDGGSDSDSPRGSGSGSGSPRSRSGSGSGSPREGSGSERHGYDSEGSGGGSGSGSGSGHQYSGSEASGSAESLDMDDPDVKAAKAAFDLYDTDASGLLSAHELHFALEKMGLAADEKSVKKVIQSWDTSKDGQLNFEEFYAFYADFKANRDPEKAIKAAWDAMNTDKKKDVLSMGELRTPFNYLGYKVTGKVLKNMTHVADLKGNEDGTITFSEFRLIMLDPPKEGKKKSQKSPAKH